ncbi:MAG TPA: hypothetical protein VME20_14065 [Acidimicrobiales bacterium]|nr:hypothetical protein [Acidimicrobiales bacterium]
MTHDLPSGDERTRADALDKALDSIGARQSPAGNPAASELGALAARLKTAIPPPELPARGVDEVRATAIALRAVRRPKRARLLVAAAMTLLVGAVAGGTLSTLIEQPGPASTNLDQLSAAVKEYGGAAQNALAHHEVGAAQRDVEKLYTVVLKAGGNPSPPPSTAGLKSEKAEVASLERTISALESQVRHLEALAVVTTVTHLSARGPLAPSNIRPNSPGQSGGGGTTSTTALRSGAAPSTNGIAPGTPTSTATSATTTVRSATATSATTTATSATTKATSATATSGTTTSVTSAPRTTATTARQVQRATTTAAPTTTTTASKTSVPLPITTSTTTPPPSTTVTTSTPPTNGIGLTVPVRLPTTTSSTTTTTTVAQSTTATSTLTVTAGPTTTTATPSPTSTTTTTTTTTATTVDSPPVS